MTSFEREIETHFDNFDDRWPKELAEVKSALGDSRSFFIRSYRRISSLSAWRSFVINNVCHPNTAKFFIEAHNDAVSSHVFARVGSWRASLKFLRSCIENILFCEYYKDHPIEMRLWDKGEHRVNFSDLLNYFHTHPDVTPSLPAVTALERIKRAYGMLSRAVHGSDVSFRMTELDEHTNIWTDDIRRLGQWNTREREVIIAVNMLLLTLHKDLLQGTSLPGLRQTISFSITSQRIRDSILHSLNINLST